MSIPSHFPARCALGAASGAVYFLGYPPVDQGWMVVPGIVGLLVALEGQRGSHARAIGFLHGMAAYALGFSWLFEIFGGMVVVLWCVLAAFTALFAEMQSRAAARGVTGWRFAAFTAMNWCAWEFVRAELFPLKFPWMTAGLAMGPNGLLPWIGVYGVGIPVLLAAAFLARRMWWSAAVPLAVVAAVVLSSRRVPAPEADDPLAVTVGGLQLEIVSLNHFLDGTRRLLAGIDHVVWPEYSVPYDIRQNKRDWKLLQDLCRDRDVTLTLGTKAEPAGGDAWRNIALTMDPTGVRGEHTKIHGVHFFDDGTPGTTALPVASAHGKIGTPICFDGDYEDVFRKMTAAGAELFMVPTMDAEKWTVRQHDQHAELTRIRACENGRWVFVCASSGVSQVVDPRGHVHSKLGALEQGWLVGTMKRETALTFYTRFGWWTPWCVLGLAGVCWVLLFLPPRKPRTLRGFD